MYESILIGPSKVWYAPVGEANPDGASVAYGAAWGGNWSYLGDTLEPWAMVPGDQVVEMYADGLLIPVRAHRERASLRLRSVMAQHETGLLGLLWGGSDAVVSSGTVARTVGFEVVPTVKKWGLETQFKDAAGILRPIRYFFHRGIIRWTGDLPFARGAVAGMPVEMLLLADASQAAGEELGSGEVPAAGLAPLASDGFGGAWGTTDGLGHTQTAVIGAGGDGLAWTQQVGTWTTSSGKAKPATLGGVVATATVDVGEADVVVRANIYLSPSYTGGVVARWTDANNYIRAYHNGIDFKLDQFLSAINTNKISSVVSFVEGAAIKIVCSGTGVTCYYNGSLVGSATIDGALTGTKHGLHGILTTNPQMDNFAVYDAALDAFVS